VSLTITLVLSLAANTSFGGLPVLASLLSRDDYLPHLFALRGDRQVFANGIWALSILSGALLIAVGGQHQQPDPALRDRGLHRLHARPERACRPLVADQAAEVAPPCRDQRPRRHDDGGRDGGVPLLEVPRGCLGRRRCGADCSSSLRADPRLLRSVPRRELGIGTLQAKPKAKRSLVIVPVTAVSRLTVHAISEALSLSDDVVAVTVVLDGGSDGDAPARVACEGVGRMGSGRASAYTAHRLRVGRVGRSARSSTSCASDHDEQIVVLIPVVIPDQVRYRFLHNQIDLVLSRRCAPAPTSSSREFNCRSKTEPILLPTRMR
jgi:hypothetical protein